MDTAINSRSSTPVSRLPPDRNDREHVWSMTAELQEIVDADPDLMKELLALFLDDSAIRLQTLNGACARADFEIARSEAHSLKGSALQVGAQGLAALCAVLESSDNLTPGQSGAMTSAIDGEFALVRRAVEKYVAGAVGVSPDKAVVAR